MEESDDSSEGNLFDLPSLFIPSIFQNNLVHISERMLASGLSDEDAERFQPYSENYFGSAIYASELDFADKGKPVFYTGVVGHGIASYYFHWHIETTNLCVSIILPYPNIMLEETENDNRLESIARASDLAALLFDVTNRDDGFFDEFKNSSLHVCMDSRSFHYAFYRDDEILKEDDSIENLIDSLSNMFPTDIREEFEIIKP